ncbi:acyl-CoA dehydrogenase family protein [Rouxiella sp. Mn2063]|uniref:acyl-CoA dehydrogenase family protein n=1 Tax=Rouxiella sp. Mn2063 TaxID=3395262 RepID=UPI003BC6334A
MLNNTLSHWLDTHALELDRSNALSHPLLIKMADAGLFGIGIPVDQGGNGGNITDVITAVSQVARHSLTAAFMFWGHRTFIEMLLQAPVRGLLEQHLPDLLSGKLAGATGLSNAMKFLSGLDELQIIGEASDGAWHISGHLYWVTNLQSCGFKIVTVIQPQDGREPFIAIIDSQAQGVRRSEDLSLMGMQGSATAALTFDRVPLASSSLLHASAATFLPRVRPHFLGIQCGMALGLAEQCLENCREHLAIGHVLHADWSALQQTFIGIRTALLSGVAQQQFIAQPAEMFRQRIALIDLAKEAVQLELIARGGKAYLSPQGDHVARRLRESAFLPLITPSVIQLRQQLAGLGQ